MSSFIEAISSLWPFWLGTGIACVVVKHVVNNAAYDKIDFSLDEKDILNFKHMNLKKAKRYHLFFSAGLLMLSQFFFWSMIFVDNSGTYGQGTEQTIIFWAVITFGSMFIAADLLVTFFLLRFRGSEKPSLFILIQEEIITFPLGFILFLGICLTTAIFLAMSGKLTFPVGMH